jgi:hypothetical protein
MAKKGQDEEETTEEDREDEEKVEDVKGDTTEGTTWKKISKRIGKMSRTQAQ